jgi:hypothetical protein
MRFLGANVGQAVATGSIEAQKVLQKRPRIKSLGPTHRGERATTGAENLVKGGPV